MNRIVKRFLCVALAALVGTALAPALAPGHDRHSPLVPPHAQFRGKSFEQWNFLYVKWFEKTYMAGESPPNMVNGVRFLPGPNGGTTEFDVHLCPGTPFVLPPFSVVGERYDDPNVPDDNPDDPILDYIFETTYVRVELDGHVLMDDFASELLRYEYGPRYFRQPITYAEPVPRGPNLNAVAALWTQGIGAIYHPLPRGCHTLVVSNEGLLGNSDLTYHITVR